MNETLPESNSYPKSDPFWNNGWRRRILDGKSSRVVHAESGFGRPIALRLARRRRFRSTESVVTSDGRGREVARPFSGTLGSTVMFDESSCEPVASGFTDGKPPDAAGVELWLALSRTLVRNIIISIIVLWSRWVKCEQILKEQLRKRRFSSRKVWFAYNRFTSDG